MPICPAQQYITHILVVELHTPDGQPGEDAAEMPLRVPIVDMN